MAALYIPWLADAARLTGYPVVEVGGWRGRGHGGYRAVEGVTGHHTADGPRGDYPSLFIVRDGRAGLAGPLSGLGLGRSGTIYVIAAGQAWHAGASRWAGFTDLNDEFIGIEAESVGTRDDWTPEQRDCYPRLVAALLFYMRRGPERFCGHKECALPAGRKIDPAYWDLGAFRARLGWYLADPLARIPRFAAPTPAPIPTLGGDAEMQLDVEYDEDGTFRAYSSCEGSSGIYSRWGGLTFTAAWGWLDDVSLYWIGADKGDRIGRVGMNVAMFREMPPDARGVVMHGRYQNTGTDTGKPARLLAAVYHKPE